MKTTIVTYTDSEGHLQQIVCKDEGALERAKKKAAEYGRYKTKSANGSNGGHGDRSGTKRRTLHPNRFCCCR